MPFAGGTLEKTCIRVYALQKIVFAWLVICGLSKMQMEKIKVFL